MEEQIQALELPCEIIYTKQAGDARRISREAVERGEEVRLYACSGDGTLNEVVNGAAGYDNAAVTNVPIGTGNDFLKIFGKECRPRFSDLAALSVGPQAAMDLIDCNGLLGIDIVCTGLDARVATDKDKYNDFPLVTGIGAYAISAVANVLFKGIAVPTVVDCGGYHFEGRPPWCACATGGITAAALCRWGTTCPTTAYWRPWWCERWTVSPSSVWSWSMERAAMPNIRT